ncbi:MAG: hypothetical protein AB7O54_08420 [Pseudomonadales bacterium]
MLRIQLSRRWKRRCLSAFTLTLSLISSGAIGQSADCSLQSSDLVGGGLDTSTVDLQLDAIVASDYSFIRLENSEIRAVYSQVPQTEENIARNHQEFAITEFTIKAFGEDQVGSGPTDYLDNATGRDALVYAEVVYDGIDRKTVYLEWRVWDTAMQVPTDQRIKAQVTIYPHSRFLEITYLDIRRAINLVDLGAPGGSHSGGVHIAHGADQWPKGYLSHDEPPGTWYSRYAPDEQNDPVDGGPLNYNGHFVIGVFNGVNGRGFGRTLPIEHTHVVKLLLSPGTRRGIEPQNYPFLKPVPVFTSYLYAVTGGGQDALTFGRQLVDSGAEVELPTCGQAVEVEARPYTHWTFDSWTGDLSGQTDNPVLLPLVADQLIGANFTENSAESREDFTGLSVGEDPLDWFDTGSNYSLVQSDGLFQVFSLDGDPVLGTSSTQTNIHTHYLGSRNTTGPGYELTGRMRISNRQAGIGITLFSQFPNQSAYYRFRRYLDGPFHLDAVGTEFSAGTQGATTPVTPDADKWYRFRLRAEDTGSQTQVRAMVWEEGNLEPEVWQAEIIDGSSSRMIDGAVGLWTFYVGNKYIDDLALRSLGPPRTDLTLTTSVLGAGSVSVNPDLSLYTEGDPVSLEAVPDGGNLFLNWSDGLSGFENPTVLFIRDNTNVVAEFAPITQHTLVTSVDGSGQVLTDPLQSFYVLTESVQLSAIADPGWLFTGWSGDLTGSDNPATLRILRDSEVQANFAQVVLDENFDSIAVGMDPVDWIETGAGNSLSEDDSLFTILALNGDLTYGTSNPAINIHSHYAVPGSLNLQNYEYTGRMYIESPGAGIGVTFLSQYPDQGAYYRLRRYGGTNFHLAPVGSSVSGTTDTGVFPTPGLWYRFRVQAEDTGTETQIRARVWIDETQEPTVWQVVATDSSPNRLVRGTVGIWGMSTGTKAWDDLRVVLLAPPRTDLQLSLIELGNGMITASPDNSLYSVGDVVTLTAVPDTGYAFTGWGGELAGVENPTTITMLDDASVTAGFTELVNYSVDVSIAGNGTVSRSPDLPSYPAGSFVTLSAEPQIGSIFSGWSGDLQTGANPVEILVAGPTSVTAHFADVSLSEDFQSYAAGDNPMDWVDTTAGNSLSEDDGLFSVADVLGENVLTTGSTLTNIHAHFTGPGGSSFSGYRYTGRMQISNPNGGIGVTFYSQYPDSTSYYRLRKYGSSDFHIAPAGTSVVGQTASGVVPIPGRWYDFVIEVEDSGSQTDIRAKVWEEGTSVPSDWQMVASDNSQSRLTSGTIGVWSMGAGFKYWDDLAVAQLAPPRSDITITVTPSSNGTVVVSPDQPLYSSGDLVSIEAIADTGFVFTGWSGALAGSENSIDAVLEDDLVIGASFDAITYHTLSLNTGGSGGGTVSASPAAAQYVLGESVTIEAFPDAGSVFAGWSGDYSSSQNPAQVTVNGDLSITAVFESAYYLSSFDEYADGDDPLDWLDTAASNALTEDQALFKVSSAGGNSFLSTSSTATNIHSTYAGLGSADLNGYEYSGRMQISSSNGGIGVTAYSQIPDEVGYYRLRRYQGRGFHIAPVGTSVTCDNPETGVTPAAGSWYMFRLHVSSEPNQTNIRAKVWMYGAPEPTDWQVNCIDDSATRLQQGPFGIWAMGPGNKLFDDLSVQLLAPPRDDVQFSLGTTAGGTASVNPDRTAYTELETLTLTATADAGFVFTGWTGDLNSTANPEAFVIVDNSAVTANFSPITYHPVILNTAGQGTIDISPPGTEFPLGDTVTLTAQPATGHFFTGWSGDLSGSTNPANFTVLGDSQITATFESGIYVENFDSLAAGADPTDWFDTDAGNSLVGNDSLFFVQPVGAGNAFSTSSMATNIHSHFVAGGSSSLSNYSYSGKMRISDQQGAVGVTFLSQFPATASYYRLRRYAGTDFHIAPFGTSVAGDTSSGITPVPGRWYQFLIEVEDTGIRTEIRAKVWEEGTQTPDAWQIQSYDDSPTRNVSGTFGVWSFSKGSKYWDDLRLNEIQ